MNTVLILICLVMTAVSANADLIHHWEFESDATDSVGSADGSLQGAAAITTGSGGKIGEAVSLTGGNVYIGGALLPETAFTLAAWVNPTEYAVQTFVAGSQQSGNLGAFIRIDNGIPAARTLPQNGSALITGGSTPLNVWTHVAFTYDSTDAVKLYVNGVQVATAPATSFTDYSNFRIGARPDNSSSYAFLGRIDDVRIYNTALSASEIALIMGDPTIATVDAGSDWITWSTQPVTLDDVDVVNNDPDAGDLTLQWSVDNPPAGVTVDITPDNVADPTITITKDSSTSDATIVTLTLTVTQPGKNPAASSMQIDVYDDACDAGQAVGYTALDATDFNFDCVTDIQDLVIMAAAWLVEYQADSPLPK